MGRVSLCYRPINFTSSDMSNVYLETFSTTPQFFPLDCDTMSLQAVYLTKYLSLDDQRISQLENLGNKGDFEIDVFRKDSFLWQRFEDYQTAILNAPKEPLTSHEAGAAPHPSAIPSPPDEIASGFEQPDLDRDPYLGPGQLHRPKTDVSLGGSFLGDGRSPDGFSSSSSSSRGAPSAPPGPRMDPGDRPDALQFPSRSFQQTNYERPPDVLHETLQPSPLQQHLYPHIMTEEDRKKRDRQRRKEDERKGLDVQKVTEKLMLAYKITQAHNLNRELPPLRCINIVPKLVFINLMEHDVVFVRQGSSLTNISLEQIRDKNVPRDIRNAAYHHMPEVPVAPDGGRCPLIRWSVFGKFGIEIRFRSFAYSGCVPVSHPGEYHLVLFDNQWEQGKKGTYEQKPCSYVTCCVEVISETGSGTTFLVLHNTYSKKEQIVLGRGSSTSSSSSEIKSGGSTSSSKTGPKDATTSSRSGDQGGASNHHGHHHLPKRPERALLTRNIGTGFQLVNHCSSDRIIVRQRLGTDPNRNKFARNQRLYDFHMRDLNELGRDRPSYREEREMITRSFKADPKNLFQLPWIEVPPGSADPLWFGWYEPTLPGLLEVRFNATKETYEVDLKKTTTGSFSVKGGDSIRWEWRRMGPVEYVIFRDTVVGASSGSLHRDGKSSTESGRTRDMKRRTAMLSMTALAPLADVTTRVITVRCKAIGLSLIGKVATYGWFVRISRPAGKRGGSARVSLLGGLGGGRGLV